jgi:hypothetical protein
MTIPPDGEGPAAAGNFDRERFVLQLLAAVIGQICPGTFERLQQGIDSTLNLLLALLGGAAMASRQLPPRP